jgi:hypothetical protein
VGVESGQPTLSGPIAVGCTTYGCGNYIDQGDLNADWPNATEPNGM